MEAVHGTGTINTVAVVGPERMVEVPLLRVHLLAKADGAAKVLAISSAADKVDLIFNMVIPY